MRIEARFWPPPLVVQRPSLSESLPYIPGTRNPEINKQLGKSKFVDVREFKGTVLVDIREYYEKEGEMRPGKKGIALTAPQWEVRLERIIHRLDVLYR